MEDIKEKLLNKEEIKKDPEHIIQNLYNKNKQNK